MAYKDAHKIIDHVVKVLFAADSRRLTAWIDRLCDRNQEVTRRPTQGFLYGGELYRRSTIVGDIAERRCIDPVLFVEIDEYLADKKKLERDKQQIRQGMMMVMEPCKTLEEIRDALPECLVDCIPELKAIERDKPAAYTLQDERSIRQFNKILPLMQIYSTARLVF